MSRTGLKVGVALAALALVLACGGGPSSPPTPSPAPPLSFARSVKVGGFCCLLYTPRVVASGGRIFVAWTQAIRYTTYIPLRRSTDGGLNFPDELAFVDASSGDRDAANLAAAPGGALSLVWEDTRNGTCDPFCRGEQVFTTRSADGGASFAPNQTVEATASSDEQRTPVHAVADNGDVLVAWQDRRNRRAEIYFARSLDAGASYERAILVDAGGAGSGEQRFPAIATQADGRVYVGWLDTRSGLPEVYLARSLDRGASFGAGAPLHPAVPAVTDRASLQLGVTGAGRLVTAWSEKRHGRCQVRCAMSLDGAQSFATARATDPATQGDQTFPALAVYGSGEVYLAWQDSRTGSDRVRVARSLDGADSFEASVLVDDPGAVGGNQQQPALSVDASGRLLAVWLDFSKADSGVYFARSLR